MILASIVGVGSFLFCLVLVAAFLVMSVVPLDLDAYKAWTIEQLYYELYPYIQADFMGKSDCQAVHQDGNMLAGESTVSHITFSGGDDTLASAKKRQYERYVEQGGRTLETAQERGEFTGRARGA